MEKNISKNYKKKLMKKNNVSFYKYPKDNFYLDGFLEMLKKRKK